MSNYLVDCKHQDGVDFNSSSIDILGYDRATETLYVEFVVHADVYTYSGVKESTYNMLVYAESVGGFFANHIRNNNNYGSKNVGTDVIELRDDVAEDDVVSEFKVGDRVVITFDDKYVTANNVWNGPGTVEKVDSGMLIIRTDNDGRSQANKTGGFYPGDFHRLDDVVDLQPDTKWLTPEGERLGALNNKSRFSVKYTAEHDGTVGGPFEPEFSADDEADALVQLNSGLDQLETLLGWSDVKVKIVSVTHYF